MSHLKKDFSLRGSQTWSDGETFGVYIYYCNHWYHTFYPIYGAILWFQSKYFFSVMGCPVRCLTPDPSERPDIVTISSRIPDLIMRVMDSLYVSQSALERRAERDRKRAQKYFLERHCCHSDLSHVNWIVIILLDLYNIRHKAKVKYFQLDFFFLWNVALSAGTILHEHRISNSMLFCPLQLKTQWAEYQHLACSGEYFNMITSCRIMINMFLNTSGSF